MTISLKGLFVTLSINDKHYAEYRFAEWSKFMYFYAECHYAECRYAECHGAKYLRVRFAPILLEYHTAHHKMVMALLVFHKSQIILKNLQLTTLNLEHH